MIQIRKIESITQHFASEVACLDPEKFRNISVPYMGNSDEDFMKYIEDLGYNLEEISNELDEQTLNECFKLTGSMEIPVWDSRTKSANEWYETGKSVDGMNKNGGFITEHSSADY